MLKHFVQRLDNIIISAGRHFACHFRRKNTIERRVQYRIIVGVIGARVILYDENGKKKNEKNNVTLIASNKNLPKTSRRDAVCILVFFYSITRGPFTVLTDGPADPRDNSRVPLSEFLFFNNSDNPIPFIPIQIRRRIHNEQETVALRYTHAHFSSKPNIYCFRYRNDRGTISRNRLDVKDDSTLSITVVSEFPGDRIRNGN